MIARQGGQVAGSARKNLESKLGKPVVTSLNAGSISVIAETADEKSSEERRNKEREQS